ncbi:MerR family transcriptional regulator [Chengkuizengella axinellae]|uniref:MerR family transcriptional regulator n=1 Tax=Chengkuizengella axinellae TaxID=3064388 RepID=A0ABT9J868_9BACL|nr:MerR family transcriptional regulator [Chengkuizengella sp. 2205SS18-9]MDP5277185.1 MerR family transcriptional regulator [Chengkuizengella sp. 2205SS18-9]
MYTISEVAKLLDVSTHTLRYYEKENIIIPDRNENKERLYSDMHLKWLKFVMKLKQTQMPIAKIREYARLFEEGEHTTQARLELLENHLLSIQNQLETLASTEKMLEEKINKYREFINQSKSETVK